MDVVRDGDSISVLIADDQSLFREGMVALIANEPDLRVVAEANDAGAAVALARQLSPDVALLDVAIAESDETATVERLQRESPTTAVVVLTTCDEPSLVRSMLDVGVAAYLTKSITRSELVTAIRAVASRRSDVLVSVSRETIYALDKPPPCVGLSPRELQVLQLAASARSNAQIARTLLITEGTVKRHLTNAYAKLEATSRVDAIRKATSAGLLVPADE